MTFVRIQILLAAALVALAAPAANAAARSDAAAPGVTLREYAVPAGSHPHDVAPAATAASGTPRRPPASSAGSTRGPAGRGEMPLGDGSAPHGVIVGPDGAPWITDGGLNAIVRVDPRTRRGQGASRCPPPRRTRT